MLSSYRKDYKAILKLGLPIVLGQFGMIVVGMADNIMVGRYGTAELAASSFVNSVFNIPILFGLGFAYGLTPLVGQSYGTNDHKNIGELLKNSLISNGGIGVILSFIMFILYLNVDVMGQPIELLPLIRSYFLLQLISIIFVMLFNSFKQFSDGIMDSLTPMYIMLFGNIVNIFGNWVLIYGKLGFPELGLIGAGISTLFSRIIMFVIFVYIFFNRNKYKLFIVGYKSKLYSYLHIIKLHKMGLMVGLQMGMETALFSISGIMIGWIGTVALAAHQIGVTLSTLGFMLYYGIGAAISVRVSSAYGQKDIQRVKKISYAGYHIILAMSLVVAIFFWFSRHQIAYMFTTDIAVVNQFVALVILLCIYQLGDGLQVTFANVLRGISDVNSMAIISFIGYFIFGLPICYIFGFIFDFGIEGVWIGYPVGLSMTGLMMFFRYRYLLKSFICK